MIMAGSASAKPALSALFVRSARRASASFSSSRAGSVANIAQEAMQGQLPLCGWGLSSQGVEQFGRSEALVSSLHHHLSFLNHMHEFDPDQGVLGCLERFEP